MQKQCAVSFFFISNVLSIQFIAAQQTRGAASQDARGNENEGGESGSVRAARQTPHMYCEYFTTDTQQPSGTPRDKQRQRNWDK